MDYSSETRGRRIENSTSTSITLENLALRKLLLSGVGRCFFRNWILSHLLVVVVVVLHELRKSLSSFRSFVHSFSYSLPFFKIPLFFSKATLLPGVVSPLLRFAPLFSSLLLFFPPGTTPLRRGWVYPAGYLDREENSPGAQSTIRIGRDSILDQSFHRRVLRRNSAASYAKGNLPLLVPLFLFSSDAFISGYE